MPRPGCTCGKHRLHSKKGTGCLPDCPCRRCYDNRHKRVYRTRGPASDQQCCLCDSRAKDWAQIHDTDGTDPADHYQPMCLRCHRAYDGWGAVMSEHKKRYWASIPVEERRRFSAYMNAIQHGKERREPSLDGMENV